MTSGTKKYCRKALKLSALAGLLMSLSGCIIAVPPAIQLASLALDGVSYATTGKSVTDHAISNVTNQDCAMLRSLQGDNICSDKQVEVAMLPDGTPAPHATDAARDIKTADNDAAFQTAAQLDNADEDQDEVLDMSDDAAFKIDMETASGPML